MQPLAYLSIFTGTLLLIAGLSASTIASVAKGAPDHANAGKLDTSSASGEVSGLLGGSSSSVPGSGGGSHKFGRLVSGALTFAGFDQGADFTGRGQILAPDDLLITKVDRHSGWPGGGLVVGQLLSGPQAGRFIYFAEAIVPHVRQGQHIAKGGLIGELNSSYPGTEIGFAQNAQGRAYGTPHDGKPGGPTPVHGEEFGRYISGG